MTEMKVRSGFGGTKRKFSTNFPGLGVTDISRRVTRLSKALKVSAPNHLESRQLAATSADTTGLLIELCSSVTQGDDYNQRFGNKVTVRRLVAQFAMLPGSASAASAIFRIVVFRAGSGASVPQFAYNSSCNPIRGNGVLQVYYDQMFTVGSATATMGFPTVVKMNVKLNKFQQKYSGTGASATTGESIYFYLIGNTASGTSAPTGNGWLDTFFQP